MFDRCSAWLRIFLVGSRFRLELSEFRSQPMSATTDLSADRAAEADAETGAPAVCYRASEPINPFMSEMQSNIQLLAEGAAQGRAVLDAEGSAEGRGTELSDCLQSSMEPSEENRQKWRSFCYGFPELSEYCSAVLMEEEALRFNDGRTLPEMLAAQGIVPAMRVDQGFVPLNSFGEKGTEGLVLLQERCEDFYRSGVRMAKWRTQLECNLEMPTDVSVWENTDVLARAARVCQENGLAFIAEIQTLQNTGSHSIERTAYVCEKFYSHAIRCLNEYDVNLEALAFSVNTCAAGPDAVVPLSDQVATYTVRTLRRTLPPALGARLLLPGNAVEPQEALRNAKAVQDVADMPISPVYSLPLLRPVITAWASGKESEARALQQRLLQACRAAQLSPAK
ncbi:unnamed protein product [Effrenium voratum]|nr:unnamed protein product [Effrenium voratum]